MYKKTNELNDDLFEICYLRCYEAFNNFINHKVFDYGLSFNCNNIEEVHNNTFNEMINQEKLLLLIKNKLFNLESKIKLYRRKNLEINEELLKKRKLLYKIIEDNDITIYDYYFKYSDYYYTLNMSYDFEFFGYAKEYFEETYEDLENLVCCQLFEFNKYIEDNDIYSSVIFVYNIKTKKIIEVLHINYYENINDKNNMYCLSDEKILKKII